MIYNTIMKNIIIDTNVILSGLSSSNGWSYKLLSMLPSNRFRIFISNPLYYEYESILKNKLNRSIYTDSDIDNFLNYVCAVAIKVQIDYLWRPHIKDPYDDHVLEAAFNGKCDYIVTYNIKDFSKAIELGIKAITPKEFIKIIEEEQI